MSKEVAEEYLSSLADLTVNSKPLINMLTMLADENVDHAPAIVQVIESHLEKVPPEVKLPILYLIDSIIKNVSKVYVPLFTQNIVNVFVSVFEKVDERTRLNMYKLRQTWADVFPARKLYVLDLRVKDIDHAWPVTAPTPTSIHFNPKFLVSNVEGHFLEPLTLDGPMVSLIRAVWLAWILPEEKQKGNKSTPAEASSGTSAPPPTSTTSTTVASTQNSDLSESVLREQLLKKQKILIELQQKKLELQLMQSKAIIEGQENQLNESNGQPLIANLVRPPINEEAAKMFSQRAAAKPKAVVMPPTTTSCTKSNSLSNSAQSKTKIAPVSTQLIEAVKSRDPRIARQVQQNKASLDVTSKEQEIYNRQLAMLKTSLAEQVAPVVLSDSNVKSHITFNVQGNLETEKQEGKSKKSIKETVKNGGSSKVKSTQISSKEYKDSATKGSKNTTSKDSRSFSSRSSQRRNHSDRSKTPPKSERSSTPGTGRNNSSRSDSKWFKESNHRHSRLHSLKASPKKVSNRSLDSPQRCGQNATDSPKSYNSSASECASIHSDSLKKTHRKSKKKHKKDDDYEEEKNFNSLSKKESSRSPGSKKKTGSFSRNEENHETDRDSHVQGVQSDEKVRSTDGGKTSQRSELKNRFEEVEKSASENVDLVTGTECVQINAGDSSSRKDSKSDRNEIKTCEKSESFNVEQNQKSDKLVSLDLELIESSPSPEPPPPPIISKPDEEDSIAGKKDELDVDEVSEDEKETKKEITGFKDVKGISKGRNYMRRNRDSSASPKEKTVDVDLRIGGPPEKQARLLYEEEKTSIIESKTLLSESLVNVSGRDVDLRLLTIRSGSPTQKRLSTENVAEEPPKKKNKCEIFDELFGSEDVDLRKMTRTTLNTGDRLPSPPPPPVISNGPSVPQVATIAPLVVGENTKVIADNTTNEFPREDQGSKNMVRDRDGFDLNRGRGYRRSWADYKVKPEAEIKPLTLPTQLELDLGQRKDLSYPSFDSPDKVGKRNFRERTSPRGELDRLGRPLLYNKLPNDPRARRESLGVLDGRDTDLRRLGNLMDRDVDTNINVNMIIAQAADQVRNGTMSLQEYNELLKQVIHVNEKQKLREAQNKSRQEMQRSQHHPRNRRSPNRFGQQNRNSPPYRHDDDRRDRRPFSDIDERLQMPWRNIQHNEPSSGFNRMSYPCGPSRGFDIPEYDDRLAKSDVWEDDSNRFRRVDDFENSTENRLRDAMCNERTHDCVDVPPADPQILELIAKDPMKSINIDGTARDIRFYGDTAVVMLSWDDPKEISFEDGIRRVVIGDLNIVCALNDPYIMFMLNGKPHRIRLGAPTRELYIDGEFYEAHFGGPPVQVVIDGLSYLVQIEGPPPQVKIGKKRIDLVCGRINIIVDATAMLPLYLDAKPQRFDLRSRPYVFRLVNHLKTLLVNEVPVDIHFGGGCRQICGYGNLHFLRLSMLPNGIEPGRVDIVNMENLGVPSVTNISDDKIESGNSSPPSNNIQQPSLSTEVNVTNSTTEVNQPQPTSQTTGGGPLDILTSLMSGVGNPQQSVGFNYQVENKDQQQLSQSSTVRPEAETVTSPSQPSTIPLLGGLNINDLFQRLVASGIVPTLSSAIGNNQKLPNETTVKPVDFSDPNSLRERQPPIINSLYSGIQCSSCGVRFSPEETLKYSRHLDWHFRQNRREKDAARKGQSRKWYYDVSDWIQFEEIEDLEERAQSWFEAEATSNGEENNEQEEIKSVPAPSGNVSPSCEVCRDQFETYYNEEKEEWHLKPCIIVDEKYYHPLCYEDLGNMPEDSLLADKTVDASAVVKDESIIDNIKTLEEKEEEDFVSNDVESNSLEMDNPNTVDSETQEEEEEEEEYINLKVDTIQQQEDNVEEVVGNLLNELINCIAYKNEMELEEEKSETEKEEDDSEEIEVLESVPVEQKKNIIDVDLIEKLDDDDDIIYQRKTPSPIVLIPPAKIKQEPVEEMESPVAVVDQTYTNVVSSIDGNVEMIDAPPVSAPAGPSRIKITFNKPLPTEQQQQQQQQSTEKPVTNEVPDVGADESDPDPLPLRPKKPRIAQREMTVYLPCVRGTEVSGLCSIM